jgi:predicted transcriptional regulator
VEVKGGLGIQILADEWREARDLAHLARRDLIEAIVKTHRAGASEYQLAQESGVTRQTIRTWLGK